MDVLSPKDRSPPSAGPISAGHRRWLLTQLRLKFGVSGGCGRSRGHQRTAVLAATEGR
jgi:hypothetical protein